MWPWVGSLWRVSRNVISAPPLPGVVFRLSRLKWRFPTIWLSIRVDRDFIVRDLQCVPSLASLLGFVWLWQATGSVLTSVSWPHHVAPACLPEEPAAEGSQGWGSGRLARGCRLGQTVKMKKSVLFHSRFFFPAKHIIVATPAISMLSSGWSIADPRQLRGRRLWEWSLRPSFATYYVTLRKVLVKMIGLNEIPCCMLCGALPLVLPHWMLLPTLKWLTGSLSCHRHRKWWVCSAPSPLWGNGHLHGTSDSPTLICVFSSPLFAGFGHMLLLPVTSLVVTFLLGGKISSQL